MKVLEIAEGTCSNFEHAEIVVEAITNILSLT